jgi:GAF domain-containing protein
MAETTLDLRAMPRGEAYALLQAQAASLLAGVYDPIAAMSTLSAMLHHGFGHLWTGFYRVVHPGRLLRVGPYQGSIGCLEIAFGRGVCGAAAAERRTIIVPDVAAFAGHIVCDARAVSEIVVPVAGMTGELIAVLDIDSTEPAAFDERDAKGLEALVEWFARPHAGTSTP